MRYVVEPKPPRHGRRHQVRRQRYRTDTRRVQRRRVDGDRPGGGRRAAPGAAAPSATIVLTPVDNPTAPTGWSRPTPTATSSAFIEKPDAGSDPLRHRSTPASTSSSPKRFDRIPATAVSWSIEREYFPSLVAARRNVRRLSLSTGIGSTSARRRSTARRTATSSTAASGRPFAGRSAAARRSSRPTCPRRRRRDD